MVFCVELVIVKLQSMELTILTQMGLKPALHTSEPLADNVRKHVHLRRSTSSSMIGHTGLLSR
jgi:hypothetical protein